MGACIASAVLTGALMVGDSVRGSLYQMAMVRLGKVDTAIVGNDRLFQEDLAQRMQDPTFAKVSPALHYPLSVPFRVGIIDPISLGCLG